jgi:hypothetical protein
MLALFSTSAFAQRPRVGVGIVGGVALGSRLLDHTFPADVAGTELYLTQRVYLTERPLIGAQLEWYVLPHLALRLHAARGKGVLEAQTLAVDAQRIDVAPFQTGFDRVDFTAFDAGISIWPWAPRSQNFTPFLSVGAGRVRYGLHRSNHPEPFFQGLGIRPRSAWVLGAGADMNVWSPVMLRVEIINHHTASPLLASDFRQLGATADPFGSGSSVRNVQLVLGVNVYFPFTGSALAR